MEEATKFMVEKLNEAPLAVKKLGIDALAWFNKVIPPETRADKIQQSKHALKNTGEVALGWVNLVFPPEKIKSLHKAKPYAIASIVLVVAVKFFGGRGGGAVKMMKAPGRNYKIPRPGFESNPRKYFGDLRAGK